MTDSEFELLDELYFVISFEELKNELGWPIDELCHGLISLHKKGWLRVFNSPDDTMDIESVSPELLVNCYLLASKAGLKAHNS